MKYKNLDPNILYPVDTKVVNRVYGEGIIIDNILNADYCYTVKFLSSEVLSYYTKSGLYLIDNLESTLFLLEQVKQFPNFENRVVIVSHKGEKWNNRVLAIQLKRGCLCYTNSASDVSAVDIYHGFTYWEHMKEIPKPTYTKQEIAKKLNLDVDSFEIEL